MADDPLVKTIQGIRGALIEAPAKAVKAMAGAVDTVGGALGIGKKPTTPVVKTPTGELTKKPFPKDK